MTSEEKTGVSREHTRTNHTAVPSSFRSAPRYLRIPVSASITQCALFFEAAKQGHIVCLFPSFASRSVNSYVVSTVVSQTRRLASTNIRKLAAVDSKLLTSQVSDSGEPHALNDANTVLHYCP